MTILSIRPQRDNSDFQLVARSFLMEKGLPLASVLPVVEIERVFRRQDARFGGTYNTVYNTAIVLWAFLSEVLADGKLRSCAAAVARVADFLIAVGKNPPSTDTGEYCHARKKRDEKALHDLVVQAAGKIEHPATDDWLWHGRHTKLVDGFTATMPDTPENQKEFPQQKSQKPGIGFPILRACATILAAWSTLSLGHYHPKAMKILLEQIASLETPNRPGRIEPRVLKRRRHRYPLMREPRQKLKKRLEHATRCRRIT